MSDGVTRHAAQACPICAHPLDAAGTFDGAAVAPAPGDWTVCSGCLCWLVYGDGFTLRPVTPAELEALSGDERATLEGQRDQVRRAFPRTV